MRLRNLLFLLFLYTALVWVAAFYRGEQIKETGLLWTGVGIGVVLLWVLLDRIFGAWRAWLRRPKARPAPAGTAEKPVHEDDAGFANLWKEAAAKLAQSPEYGVAGRKLNLDDLPLYLILGSIGAGKTTTFINSGLAAHLLAGESPVSVPALQTRIANIWIAKDTVFVEISGRIFDGDIQRFSEFLRVLHKDVQAPVWKRVWRDEAVPRSIRGVILIEDIQRYKAGKNEKAGQDAEKLNRRATWIQDRLAAVISSFNAVLPVSVVFSKTDRVLYFEDFFRHLPESESDQVFGQVTVAADYDTASEPNLKPVTRNRSLSHRFLALASRLAERRPLHLIRETDAARKSSIYEFPREFRRLRTSISQFLNECFRPNPLKLNAVLFGFFFTAR